MSDNKIIDDEPPEKLFHIWLASPQVKECTITYRNPSPINR